jgi:molecular chaperone DnaK (HSP70)
VVCLAPRALGDSVRPRRSSGVVVRPLNFTIGDVFTAILPKGCAIACLRAETFGTAEDRQSQITIHMFRGDSASTSAAHPLGTFQITGFPLRPRGKVIVQVTFWADDSGIQLSAKDSSGVSNVALSRVAPEQSFEGAVTRGWFGSAGAGGNYAPASPICRFFRGPQLHR